MHQQRAERQGQRAERQGQRVAVITGASQGLGLALARALAADGWSVVIDARDATRLAETEVLLAAAASAGARVLAVAGDVSDPAHRDALAAHARALGPVQLLVNNASTLGASPLPAIDEITVDVLHRIFAVNVIAPLALVRTLAGDFAPTPTVIDITSDAAVEPYPGWGGYGASKAALEHASAILAAEHPEWRVLVVDPGDMRTEMHQDAFPGEDISDRPPPDDSVPGLMALIDGDFPSGRYHARGVV
ncbi:MAG TPA: SDR family oxidoreductase [Acidimicrobiales bacterium]|nr:SDR family oxidoreductase [Acidimicrobiales bacterium]